MSQWFETRALPLWEADARALIEGAYSGMVLHAHPEDVVSVHIRVGLLREMVPGMDVQIAPTSIPQRHIPASVYTRWDEVYSTFKPFLVRKVLLTGPESTGKTTLASALAEQLGYGVVPEYLREFWLQHGGCTYGDLEGIAATQIAREYEFAQTGLPGLVCDTSPLSTLVYAQHYFGRTPRALEQWARLSRYDVILFLDDDLPWVQDGQRDSERVRSVLKDAFLSALEHQKAPYHVIQGSGEQRVARALALLGQAQVAR